MQSSKTVSYIDEHRFFWFKINRPDKRNAVDYDVMNELEQALKEVKRNTAIRAFIITGTGEHSFCSGGDLSVFHALHTKEDAYAMLSKMGAILYSLMTLPVPTYALINGTAIGGGCEIASACDQRWALPHAKLGFVQGKLGITTGWGGASMLFEKIPSPQALQMLNSATIYPAEEAETLGFVQKIVPAIETRALHESLVQSSGVLRSYKQALVSKWEQTNLKERMLAEIEQCAYLWEQDEHHSAVERFLQSKKK
ncbi:enoyl-CoA hydratase/isomerase family protein [Sutcliffiella sp. NPDC057660]|uniref:enoyl-CoA hydratase/isomerase family protein n=1 Tax=Sutcliffiella sp. NPDC057660 TaxID=3346199 RepID=UPI0036809909